MSRRPLARVAGPIVLAAGALLLIQQLVALTIFDRSRIEATMANPLFVPLAVAYFLSFCGLLVAAISAAILVGGLLSGVPIGVAYLSGGVVLGLAIASLGVWMLRTTAAASAVADSAAI